MRIKYEEHKSSRPPDTDRSDNRTDALPVGADKGYTHIAQSTLKEARRSKRPEALSSIA